MTQEIPSSLSIPKELIEAYSDAFHKTPLELENPIERGERLVKVLTEEFGNRYDAELLRDALETAGCLDDAAIAFLLWLSEIQNPIPKHFGQPASAIPAQNVEEAPIETDVVPQAVEIFNKAIKFQESALILQQLAMTGAADYELLDDYDYTLLNPALSALENTGLYNPEYLRLLRIYIDEKKTTYVEPAQQGSDIGVAAVNEALSDITKQLDSE